MPVVIKLVRHGESEANINKVRAYETGDHVVALSELGRAQAVEVGRTIGADFLRSALLYQSPYRRTRETLDGILDGAGVAAERHALRIYEDPRLREVEHGYEPVEEQERLRETHGWFYYRYRGGESPADCFDRTSGFLDTMMRQAERKSVDNVLIVTHGLTIRCFVMRYLHLRVEDFDAMETPDNCDVVTIALRDPRGYTFSNEHWGVTGLRRRA